MHGQRGMIVGKPMTMLLMAKAKGANATVTVAHSRTRDLAAFARTAEKGYRLVGDVAFNEVAPKCKAITPVPGGVGPMTIAMLMANTIKACRQLG